MKKSTNIAAERKPAVRALVLALSCIGLASLPLTEVMANPQGGQVVAGSAAIRQETPNKIGITQTTDKTIIDWRSFSIGAKEQVQFYQPGASSVTLNRVVGQDPSQILGRLTANGQVFLVNPNGIYFGKNAQIDVAGLVASTHNIRNEDFLAGKYSFNIPGKPGAAVINEGSIHIADTGIAAFVAPSVANRGVIVAKLGKVALASANGFTLDFTGDQLLTFLVGDEVAKTAFDIEGKQLTSFVDNSGRIEAQGGYVLLTAKAAENAIHSVINQSGVIEATTVGTHNGEIILNAGKGSLSVSGTLDASAPNGGDGGFIETSGAHVAIDPNTKITTAAAIGKTGVWLIDPVNFTIAATGGDMTGAALATALGLNSVVIQSISGATGTTGDININDSVNWSAHKLTLNAQNNININANLNGTGTASLALEYGQGSVAAGNLSDYFVNAAVNLPAGQNFSTKQGSTGSVKNYTVITSLGAAGSITATDLQGMNGNLATGNYALGADIDAAATKNWGAGSGFSPVGSPILAFAGWFDGLGHTISNLTINRPATADVGLFGIMGEGSAIQNVGIVGGSVSGSSVVGGLVGACYYCNIHNSYATDNVTASSNGGVGGLVGNNTGGTISNSYATGNVGGVGSWADAGGLVGKSSWGTISNSYAMGDVSGPNGGVGGLVGVNRSAISNSYATGNVSGNSYYVGGLIGWNNSTVTNSYATGNVSGTGNLVGGLVGYTSGYGSGYNDGGTGTIINSYWNTQTSGQATSSGGGTGKTTAQMQQQASFSGWDFVNTWEILPGATRPTLKVLNAQTVNSGAAAAAEKAAADAAIAATAAAEKAAADARIAAQALEDTRAAQAAADKAAADRAAAAAQAAADKAAADALKAQQDALAAAAAQKAAEEAKRAADAKAAADQQKLLDAEIAKAIASTAAEKKAAAEKVRLAGIALDASIAAATSVNNSLALAATMANEARVQASNANIYADNAKNFASEAGKIAINTIRDTSIYDTSFNLSPIVMTKLFAVGDIGSKISAPASLSELNTNDIETLKTIDIGGVKLYDFIYSRAVLTKNKGLLIDELIPAAEFFTQSVHIDESKNASIQSSFGGQAAYILGATNYSSGPSLYTFFGQQLKVDIASLDAGAGWAKAIGNFLPLSTAVSTAYGAVEVLDNVKNKTAILAAANDAVQTAKSFYELATSEGTADSAIKTTAFIGSFHGMVNSFMEASQGEGVKPLGTAATLLKLSSSVDVVLGYEKKKSALDTIPTELQSSGVYLSKNEKEMFRLKLEGEYIVAVMDSMSAVFSILGDYGGTMKVNFKKVADILSAAKSTAEGSLLVTTNNNGNALAMTLEKNKASSDKVATYANLVQSTTNQYAVAASEYIGN